MRVFDRKGPGSDAAEPVLLHVATTRYTAEQWKSRALYEETCKLSAERALARAMDVLQEASLAAAHARAVTGAEDQGLERRLRPIGPKVASGGTIRLGEM